MKCSQPLESSVPRASLWATGRSPLISKGGTRAITYFLSVKPLYSYQHKTMLIGFFKRFSVGRGKKFEIQHLDDGGGE